MILKNNGVLYRQLKDILMDRIIKNIYPKGSLLPTENQLEEEFKLSKITIRKAVELLAQEGWVEKKAGLGTKVIENKKVIKLKKGQNFTEILITNGHTLEKKVKNIEICSLNEETEEFKLFGNNCFKMIRVVYLDNKPYIYSYHYFPLELNLPLDKIKYETSLYDTLEKNGTILSNFEDHLFAITAPKEVKDFLLKEVVLGRKRFSYDENFKLIEFSISYYNSDDQEYIIKLNS